jgi:hypothetical protein
MSITVSSEALRVLTLHTKKEYLTFVYTETINYFEAGLSEICSEICFSNVSFETRIQIV